MLAKQSWKNKCLQIKAASKLASRWQHWATILFQLTFMITIIVYMPWTTHTTLCYSVLKGQFQIICICADRFRSVSLLYLFQRPSSPLHDGWGSVVFQDVKTRKTKHGDIMAHCRIHLHLTYNVGITSIRDSKDKSSEDKEKNTHTSLNTGGLN